MHTLSRAHQGLRRPVTAKALRLAATGLLLALGAQAQVRAESFDYVGWDAYLGGAEASQFSSLDQVNRSNVGKLTVAWTFQAGEGQPPHYNPIVIKGVMYFMAPGNALVALDAATGKELWRKTNIGSHVGLRGMNYWQSADGKDRRLLFVADGMLRAVSADTGDTIAGFGQDGKVDLRTGLDGDLTNVRPLQTDNPGRVYKNLIIMSLPAGAYDFASSPADVHAYDIRTGKLVWIFHVVPRKGEFGSDTWPATNRDKLGGVHNWSESALDDKAGVVYIPTGTARYDFYGGNRPGNNLFANSILALDAKTGKRLWHFQTVHHDLWDYDIPQAPKLMTIHKDGKDIPVLIQATKSGFVFVLDRRTGKPIWPVEERPVPKSDTPGEQTSPTQPFPTWPKPFARQSFTEADINPYVSDADKAKLHELFKTARNEGLFTPPSVEGTISMPGHNGGANWGTSAVDPVHARYFVMAKQLPTYDKLFLDKRPTALAAMPNGGGDVQPYKSPVNFMVQSNGLPAISPPWSTITAYDMNTGNIIWQVPDGDIPALVKQGIKDTGSEAPRGSPVATGGGLLFIGTSSDRKFRARDAETGKVLWDYDLPAATEGVPAVYQIDGREFIVIPVGGDGLFPAVQPDMPKAGPNQYIAFALPAGGDSK